jgi:uncharacterized protein
MNEFDKEVPLIQKLCIKYNVDKLYLFGSSLNDRFNENSDVDFIVKFKNIDLLKYADNYFNLKFSLEHLFNRPVDLLEEQAIKNPYFLESVNESKQLVYG